jgi:hypothetical protein
MSALCWEVIQTPVDAVVLEAIEAPEAPEAPEVSDVPEATKVTKVSEVSEVSEATEVSDVPEATKAIEAPEVSEVSKVSEVSEAIEATEVSEATEVPKAPEIPKARAANRFDQKFLAIAEAVANAKNGLDEIPPKDYTLLARELDIYGQLKKRLSKQFRLRVVTNATLKLYEMLNTFELIAVPPKGGRLRIRAFCNAELPGAFLIALNSYVLGLLSQRVGRSQIDFDWVASSYLPEAAGAGSTILDDEYGIYASHRDRWFMGPRPNAMPEGEPAVSGDVTDSSVVAAIADAVHARYPEIPAESVHSGATLYTSDAGIDVSGDYNRQEEHTALLNFGQILCGILSLAPGGVLITKQYSFLTEFNREVITVLSALFDCLRIVKPVTSRPANSEIYLIGVGFRGVSREMADSLLDTLTVMKQREVAPGLAIQQCYLLRGGMAAYPAADHQLLDISDEIAQTQIKYLKEIVSVFQATRGKKLDDLRSFTESIADTAIENWMSANPMVHIAK